MICAKFGRLKGVFRYLFINSPIFHSLFKHFLFDGSQE
ncbi:hypothetical protein CAMRE0001_1679 [Campylobacter rectus RM3267]|uniref:Uncharacterized protein n=1 Tax=Campylobacter rectus RM3267 TaxID=553218 RepID=B9CZ97_CAMRE|nr:hypothetical protein CAMRE0001_1679 [Campylobacter rectus RM3267]